MNAGTVTGIAFDVDLTTAHRIADCIADIAENGDMSVVHGIADGILRVAADCDPRALQISAQRVSGSSVNGNRVAVKAGGQKTLSQTTSDQAVILRGFQFCVQCAII